LKPGKGIHAFIIHTKIKGMPSAKITQKGYKDKDDDNNNNNLKSVLHSFQNLAAVTHWERSR